MAFSYFTESRLVPIYESNPKTTASPATVNLNPQTEVETVTDQDSYNLVADPYVQVQVTAGVPNGAQPAWWPDGWVLRKFLRKCLKRNAPSSVTGESFTGVSFGDYKFTSDVGSKTGSARFVKKQEIAHKPEKGPPVYKPGYVCAACGRLSADHRLYETTSLKALAQSLVNAHIVAGRDRPPMFGLLDVRESNGTNRQMVVAESGFNYRFEPTIQAQAALFLGVAHHYVTLTDITAMNDTYKDCNGGTVTAQGKKFTCAAPKLVQYYAHNLRTTYAAPVIYMTEIAVASQGIYVEGHTSESCDTCRNTIPKMLCTLTNLERQADGGRYPRRERS